MKHYYLIIVLNIILCVSAFGWDFINEVPPWELDAWGMTHQYFSTWNTNTQQPQNPLNESILPDTDNYWECWYRDGSDEVYAACYWQKHQLRRVIILSNSKVWRKEYWKHRVCTAYIRYTYRTDGQFRSKAKYIRVPRTKQYTCRWWLYYEYDAQGRKETTYNRTYYYDDFSLGYYFVEHVLHYNTDGKLIAYQKQWQQKDQGPYNEQWYFYQYDDTDGVFAGDPIITEEHCDRIMRAGKL